MSEPPFPQVCSDGNKRLQRKMKKREEGSSTIFIYPKRSRAALALRFVPIAVKSRHSRLPPLYSAEQPQSPNQLIIVFVPLTWSGPWRRDVSVRVYKRAAFVRRNQRRIRAFLSPLPLLFPRNSEHCLSFSLSASPPSPACACARVHASGGFTYTAPLTLKRRAADFFGAARLRLFFQIW